MEQITPLPHRLVPDWAELARIVAARGPVLVPPTIDANSAHASLHRFGLGVRQVREAGAVVAYRVGPLRQKGASS